MSYAVLIQTPTRVVPHYFTHESDARHYLAQCQAGGYQAVLEVSE